MNEREKKILNGAAANIRWVKRRLENRSPKDFEREIWTLEAQREVISGLTENPLDKLEQIEIE